MPFNRIAVLAVLVSILLSPLMLAEVPGTMNEFVRGVTEFNGAMYLFYGSVNPATFVYSLYYTSSINGENWPPTGTAVPIPASLNQTEGLVPVAFNGRLYIFWHGWDWHSIYYMSMDQFGVWATAKKIPNATADGDHINAIVYNNRLYVMWRAVEPNTSLFYNSMGTNGTWQFSANARLSAGESFDGPTAAILRMADGVEYLYAFWRDRSFEDYKIWYARMTPNGTWSATSRLNTPDYPLTGRRPAAVADGNKIDLIYRGAYTNQHYIKEMSKTGTWTIERSIPISPPAGPIAIRFNGATWVFYHDYAIDAITSYTYF